LAILPEEIYTMRRPPPLHSIFIFLALAACTARAQPASKPVLADPVLDRVRTRLESWKSAADFPGMTAAFVLPDGRSASASIGLADVENNIALKPTDRLLAGSTGKTFVAAITLQLVAEKTLDLDTKIEKWLSDEPWFARLPNGPQITLRMLLNHTSGIREHVLDKGLLKEVRENPDRVWKPAELVAPILGTQPLFEAGKGWSYADTNYIIVGIIIERVTKRTVYDLVRERLLNLFKLDRTIPADRRVLPDLAVGYSRPDSPFGFTGRTIIDGKFVINPQFEWCGGGFASTAQELARWMKDFHEGKAFDAALLREVHDGKAANTGPGDKYGLGCQIRTSPLGDHYGHGGWFPGYLTEAIYFPKQRIAVAVQFNTDAIARLKRLPRAYAEELAAIVLGE
jgi:D-alanyl-D-alanine carboxypeptidase